MISTNKVAYSIGFSSSLKEDTWSGYNELSRWVFPEARGLRMKLHKHFLRGYDEGLKIVREVRLEMKNFLVAGEE